MISFSNVSKQYGRQVLFIEADFQLNPGEKVGLVGPNGSGKSTIFRMIMGEEHPDDGTVSMPRKLTVGYFRQEVDEMAGRSVLEEAIKGSGRLGDLHPAPDPDLCRNHCPEGCGRGFRRHPDRWQRASRAA